MRKFAMLVVVFAFAAGFASSAFARQHVRTCDRPCHHAAAAKDEAPVAFEQPQAVGVHATCPVSGKEFAIGENTEHSEYEGHYYYFCCAGCKPQFDANPDSFLKKETM